MYFLLLGSLIGTIAVFVFVAIILKLAKQTSDESSESAVKRK